MQRRLNKQNWSVSRKDVAEGNEIDGISPESASEETMSLTTVVVWGRERVSSLPPLPFSFSLERPSSSLLLLSSRFPSP